MAKRPRTATSSHAKRKAGPAKAARRKSNSAKSAPAKDGARKPAAETAHGRAILIRIDQEIRNELDVLARMREMTIQQLGHEAICDLLRKHGRPTGLMDAFKQSAGAAPAARKARSRSH